MNWLRRWWPALVWGVAISSFSTGTFTSENTSHVIIPLLHWIFPHASADQLDTMHFFVRKSGHFVEYFIFSLLVLRGFLAGHRDHRLRWALVTVLLVAPYASLDEFHQSFVPGRTAAVSDVLLDTTGGAAAQAVAALPLLWAAVRQRNRAAGA
jgi:VanZ family protein